MSPADAALCNFAEKLTTNPTNMAEDDIKQLREANFDDREIHDASQVVSFFNYINRIADSLDVELEDFTHSWELSVPG